MTDQSEPRDEAQIPLWNGWAVGMFCGLIAATAVLYGASRAITHGNEWSHLANDFRSTCGDQYALRAQLAALVDRNTRLRQRLHLGAHDYPTQSPMDGAPLQAWPPIVTERYVCGITGDESAPPNLPEPHLASPSWRQLTAALGADPREFEDHGSAHHGSSE